VYATAACDSSDYLREDQFRVNHGLIELTDSTTYTGEIVFDGATFTVTDLATSGSTSDLTAQTLTLNGDCVAGTNFYYALSSTASSYSAAAGSLYVAYYSASGCANSTYVGQDQIPIGGTCTALTSDSALYGSATWSFPTLTLNDRCTSTCTTTCDGKAIVPTTSSNCQKSSGGTYYYAISGWSLEPGSSGSSILSFAAVALCALSALLF